VAMTQRERGAKLQQVFDKIAWEPPAHSAATR
jgi:hypothetical protein